MSIMTRGLDPPTGTPVSVGQGDGGVVMSRWAIARAILWGIVVLQTLSWIGQVLARLFPNAPGMWEIVRLTYVDQERNIPTAGSVLLYAALALASYLLVRRLAPSLHAGPGQAADRREVRFFRVLIVVAVIMGLDEFVGIHEDIGLMLGRFTALDGVGYPAVIVCILAVVVVVSWTAPAVLEQPPDVRRLLLVGAGLSVLGAAGLELIGGHLVAVAGNAATAERSWPYVVEVHLEETAEMIGVWLGLRALMLRLDQLGGLRLVRARSTDVEAV